jgi:hypothetical protein
MNHLKPIGMVIENADSILYFIYYSLLLEESLAEAMVSRSGKAMKEKLRLAVWDFITELRRVYGANFISRLRRFYKTKKRSVNKNPYHGSGEEYTIYCLAGADSRCMTEDTLMRLACIPDYALEFLFAFNAEHEIIKELLPRLPEAEEAFITASTIIESTRTPSQCILLAASTEVDSIDQGYIMKNCEFQGYTFSIYKEAGNSYSFEFISLHESLKNKVIHVSIVSSHHMPVIIEEKCPIDTRQYALSYEGILDKDTDIRPAIITGK